MKQYAETIVEVEPQNVRGYHIDLPGLKQTRFVKGDFYALTNPNGFAKAIHASQILDGRIPKPGDVIAPRDQEITVCPENCPIKSCANGHCIADVKPEDFKGQTDCEESFYEIFTEGEIPPRPFANFPYKLQNKIRISNKTLRREEGDGTNGVWLCDVQIEFFNGVGKEPKDGDEIAIGRGYFTDKNEAYLYPVNPGFFEYYNKNHRDKEYE
ncbi:MAG: hypothetical protein FWC61_00160 [Proteobacteria bacterium]|nr:hypothetical protein [Pseudomonadota bacterium]